MLKWIGAVMIVAGGAMFGLCLVLEHRREEGALGQLVEALDLIQGELQFRLTPLPELCALAGGQGSGCVGQIFRDLGMELEYRQHSDVAGCMEIVLGDSPQLPERTERALKVLGSSLGRFDAQGQLRGLEYTRSLCMRELEGLHQNRETRLRSYQTLGLCAGAAIAIIMI